MIRITQVNSCDLYVRTKIVNKKLKEEFEMGLFDKFLKKNKEDNTVKQPSEKLLKESKGNNTIKQTYIQESLHRISTPEEFLDDITFIQEIKHISNGPWHQYDVLLAASGYGWEPMIEWADYMSQSDFEHVDQLSIGLIGNEEKIITESYFKNGRKLSKIPELKSENEALSIAGISKTLKAPLKIVWINQTRVLRFLSFVDDELLMKKYAETVVRRTFGTKDEMKLGKPIPKEQ